MGSDDEFKALAEAAFAKMILREFREFPDPGAPVFTQLVAFLDESDQAQCEHFSRSLSVFIGLSRHFLSLGLSG